MCLFSYGIIKDIVRVQDLHSEYIKDRFVTYNGWLRTDGNKLVNQSGEEIQLRGVSTFYIGEYYRLYTEQSIKSLKEEMNVNVLRVAMATNPTIGGYIGHKNIKKNLIDIVDIAIKLDMYVIIDWHILDDNDPLTYINESDDFFKNVSDIYKDNPNVIYEICNEPNGKITWNDNIVPYANRIIKTIRNNSPKSLIIVGTPEWCKDLSSAAENPLEFNNILYALHFYSGSHGSELMEELDHFRNKGLPVFVSECGMTLASGDGTTSVDKFKDWIKFLDERNVSWVYWKFSNKGETSDMLVGNYMQYHDKAYNLDDYLSPTGKEIKQILLSYDTKKL
jgi:endoglucanase